MKPEVPEGWQMVPIGSILRVLGGFAFKSADFAETGSPVIRISNLDGSSVDISKCARIPNDKIGKASRFKLEPGDTLIAMSGATTGKLGFVPDDLSEDWYLNQRVGAFRISHGSPIDRSFFRLLLGTKFYQSHVWNLAGGAAQPNISGKQLESAVIPLPPLAEQKRIAGILDAADALRAKRRESLAQLDTLLQSTFLNLFGDPVTNPMGWEVKPLSHFAVVQRGRFSPRPRNDPSYYDGEYPFIQTGDIANSGGYVTTWRQTLNDKGTKVSKCFDPGTIVIAIVGATIGRTAILSIRAYCPDSVVGISTKPDVTVPAFLEMTLRSRRDELLKRAPQTARANLNLEILKPFPLACPPLDLQRRFATIVESIEQQKTRLRTHLAELDALFASLQSRAFNGEL